MRLSEAIRIGIQLRPETHRERFAYIANLDKLGSDAWGAACEAVQPAVANFDWKSPAKFERCMDALRAVQLHYFKDYFQMPALCPGAKQSYIQARGRIVSNRGEGQLKIEDDYAKVKKIGGVTTECELVETLAGAVDHMFYKHNWSREQVANVVEAYEHTRNAAVILGMFEHYSINQDKYSKGFVRAIA